MKYRMMLAGILCAFFVSSAHAGGWATGTVAKTMVTADGYLGGCLVKVTPDFSSLGLSACDNEWVTFDCASRGSTEKDAAMRAFDSAMVAFALDRRLQMFISDAEVIDGYCLGTSVAALREGGG